MIPTDTEVTDGTQMIFRIELPDQLTEPQTAEWMSTGMLVGWAMTIDRMVFPRDRGSHHPLPASPI
ncbi:MAG: hypothetical protein ACO1O4_10795 [Devosia sp.]